MLRNVYTSPQLTVEAKIVLFLMVSHIIICGVVPTSRTVKLYSHNTKSMVRVFPNNDSVMATGSEDCFYTNFTISTNKKLQNEIYSTVTNKSICVNNELKLVTMKRLKKPRKNCLFKHKVTKSGFDRYLMIKHRCFVGFNETGYPLSMTYIDSKHQSRHKRVNCTHNIPATLMIKLDDKSKDVSDHNREFDQKRKPK